MMAAMKWNRKRRAMLREFEQRLEGQFADAAARLESVLPRRRSAARVALTAAWVTGAVAVISAGLYAGKEIRSRYKQKRKTPYDFYAHSGDPSDLEFGVGI